MCQAAWAAGSLNRLARIRLQPSNQFLQVVRRHGFLANNQKLSGCNQRDRLEVLQHIVRESQNSTIEDVRSHAAEAERVAVRYRAGDAAGADTSGGASQVLDNDRLTKRNLHALAQDSRG